MSVTALLGLVLIVLALAGLLVARSSRHRERPPQAPIPRAPGRTRSAEPAKSRLTLVSEVTGIAGFIITIVSLLVR